MKLELYIPGLLAVPARLAARLEPPRAPALKTWCARSRSMNAAAGRYGFFRDALAVQQPPLAALAWLGATGKAPASPVFLAAPVHLRAGMSDLVLFSGSGLEVSDAERERLASDIEAFFDGNPGMKCRDGKMFLLAPEELDVVTTPLHEAQGAAVRDKLPRGADAKRVHAWMNELQMFLHDHAINRERTARGLPPVNGIWPWGEGEIPRTAKRDVVVFAKTPAMRGLGTLLGRAREHDAIGKMLPSSGHHVIEFSDCVDALDADDINGWRAAGESISDDILQPVLDWLARHREAEAVLHAGDGKARKLRGGKDNPLRRMFRRAVSLHVAAE